MPTDYIAELALEFGRSMSEMKNHLRQYILSRIKTLDLDITFELLEIMALLWRKDGVNQQELACIAVRDKSSMTYLIDNLVKRNLVYRSEDEHDKRNKIIFLTEAGKQLQEQIYPSVIDMYTKATSKVNASDMEKAISLVKKMNDNLKKANRDNN